MSKGLLSRQREIEVCGRAITLGQRSRIVGILNVTPDSFSDGGKHAGLDAAVAEALRLFDEGATIVDIGGESTRPGFTPVAEAEEIQRVAPVVKAVVELRPNAQVSVDTSKAAVARAALEAGACWVNDVWGFLQDPEIATVAASAEAGAILMRNGRDGESQGSVVERIKRSWEKSLEIATRAGVRESRIVLDPGVGFGTRRHEDLEILRALRELREFGFPVMLGASRKRITSLPLGLGLEDRLETTLATTAAGIAAGVDFFRVHDVAPHARFASLADLIERGGSLDD